MVRLLLTTGVMNVVLRAVCVTVTKVVVGVCRQEHANSMSEDGRERMLDNMPAASVGGACLLRMVRETVVLTVSVSVLYSRSVYGMYPNVASNPYTVTVSVTVSSVGI